MYPMSKAVLCPIIIQLHLTYYTKASSLHRHAGFHNCTNLESCQTAIVLQNKQHWTTLNPTAEPPARSFSNLRQNQNLTSWAVGQSQPRCNNIWRMHGEKHSGFWLVAWNAEAQTDRAEAWSVMNRRRKNSRWALSEPAQPCRVWRLRLGFLLDVRSVRTYVNLWVLLLNMGTTTGDSKWSPAANSSYS